MRKVKDCSLEADLYLEKSSSVILSLMKLSWHNDSGFHGIVLLCVCVQAS